VTDPVGEPRRTAFDGYQDIQLAGEGGLGRVYRAVRASTGGVVAIKELREVPAASPAWHRARRELDAMLRLKGHPFVVSVEEIFDGPEGPCIVMEYLDGGSLTDRLRFGRMSVPELILAGEQITPALAAAHQVGVVHRDVKPHNVLVGSFGQMKVADFGIAALTRNTGLNTRTQAFTLAYASPEELDGDTPVGAPADVYSFAATMFHLATARKPSFRDRTSMSDWHEVANRHPVMVTVVDALRRSLELVPDRRPSMDELQAVFGVAATQLGETRIRRLLAPGASQDPPVLHPPAPVTHRVGDPFAASAVVGATVVVGQVPGATTPTVATPNGPAQNRATHVESARPGRGRLIGGAAAAVVAVVGVGALVLALTRGQSRDEVRVAAAATTSPATTPSTAPAGTTATTTAAPITAAPTVAPTTPTTAASVVVVTAPPQVSSPPLISEATAVAFFDDYLRTSLAGSLTEGWAMLSPEYQAKYKSFDTYANFWSTVSDTGIRQCTSYSATSTTQFLRCYVFYGRVRDGAILNEVVDVDVSIDPRTSEILITDYRYLGTG
jgi:hypothetical protein